MASIEEEFETIEKGHAWPQIFGSIRTRSLEHNFSTKDAKRAENRSLNRYRDVSPYDHSRVVLHRSDIDYINASLVPVEDAGRGYILTQGPLAATLPHFWLMIWEKNTKGIVMLNKLIEKNFVKCHQYWPDMKERELVFENVSLRVCFIAESSKENYICRTFRLFDSKTDSSRDILQFHYVNWPDFGVPQSPNDFLDFLDDVRSSGCLNADVGPAVIHCSAGIGRSGTFCVVDSILKMIEEGREETDIRLQDVLVDMRRFRMSLIQTAEQLRFSYLAIIEALRRRSNRSPYLARKDVEEKAPPRPPHRTTVARKPMAVTRTWKMVVNRAAVSSSDEDDDEDADKNSSPMAESSESRDSAMSLEMSSGDEDSGGAPPPLPPRDIPLTDSLISPDDSPSKSDKNNPHFGNEIKPQETQQLNKDLISEDIQKDNGERQLSQHSPAERSSVHGAASFTGNMDVTEDLQKFEHEILAKETMQQAAALQNASVEVKEETDPLRVSEDSERFGVAQVPEDNSTELRQRRRLRDQKIKEKIEMIKKGIADAEASHQRRGVLGKIGIGVVVLVGTGILVYRIYNYWHS